MLAAPLPILTMRGLMLTLLLLLSSGCCCTERAAPNVTVTAGQDRLPDDARSPGVIPTSDSTTIVEMRNVLFRVDRDLALNIRNLKGRMQPLPGHEVVDFNDPSSFFIGMAYAEIGMAMDNLTYLLQRYVFGYEGSPLSISSVEAADDEIRQTGTLHNVVDIPFEMTATVTATPDGRIRLRPTSMQICGIPGQGLMNALGIELADLLDLSDASGVAVDGNDLLMDPQKLLPPPAIRGRITAVRVEGDELVQVFGRADEAPTVPEPSMPDAKNYMFYAGGTLHFGKLYMVSADLQIIDDDPSDPFEFFLREYMAQLVAGSSRTMPDAGLAAYFPDFGDLDH